MRLGFYRMNEIREFMRVLNKKYGRVVTHQIEDTLFGVKLGGKSTDIPHGIGGACSSLNRGKTHKYRRDFLRVGEKICFGDGR